MNLALIGYGKMGKTIERIALKRGHQIVAIIDRDNQADFTSAAFASADAAIEFTAPDVAEANIRLAWAANVPVVSGTTGWKARLTQLQTELETNEQTLFWASNFSLGVNLFFAINEQVANLMSHFDDYQVSLTEVHHTQKKDAPSGTAITLAEGIIKQHKEPMHWALDTVSSEQVIGIQAIRQGDVPGTHMVTYTGATDTITLTHQANNREGFAIGAVLAAEYIVGKKGFISMKQMLGI